jgi:hypothetical protein
MRKLIVLGALVFGMGAFGLGGSTGIASLRPMPTPTPETPATSSNANKMTIGSPSIQEINDEYVKQITAAIKGREKDPAPTVFKNVRWLKDVSAGTFLSIMNFGYSRGLGVTCTHCHVTSDFSSDAKREKRAAREMAVMHRMINQQLKTMKELTPKPDRAINCSTCHRGAADPMSVQLPKPIQ